MLFFDDTWVRCPLSLKIENETATLLFLSLLNNSKIVEMNKVSANFEPEIELQTASTLNIPIEANKSPGGSNFYHTLSLFIS